MNWLKNIISTSLPEAQNILREYGVSKFPKNINEYKQLRRSLLKQYHPDMWPVEGKGQAHKDFIRLDDALKTIEMNLSYTQQDEIVPPQDVCPQCGSDNISNEQPPDNEVLEVHCFNCGNTWYERAASFTTPQSERDHHWYQQQTEQYERDVEDLRDNLYEQSGGKEWDLEDPNAPDIYRQDEYINEYGYSLYNQIIEKILSTLNLNSGKKHDRIEEYLAVRLNDDGRVWPRFSRRYIAETSGLTDKWPRLQSGNIYEANWLPKLINKIKQQCRDIFWNYILTGENEDLLVGAMTDQVYDYHLSDDSQAALEELRELRIVHQWYETLSSKDQELITSPKEFFNNLWEENKYTQYPHIYRRPARIASWLTKVVKHGIIEKEMKI